MFCSLNHGLWVQFTSAAMMKRVSRVPTVFVLLHCDGPKAHSQPTVCVFEQI